MRYRYITTSALFLVEMMKAEGLPRVGVVANALPEDSMVVRAGIDRMQAWYTR